jgi:beta-galactosidase
VVLRLDWVGDVMRLHIGDRLIADQFWSGRALEVDLSGYRDLLAEHPIRLEAFAWDPVSPVHVDPRVRPAAGDPVLRVEEAALLVRRYARVRTTP